MTSTWSCPQERFPRYSYLINICMSSSTPSRCSDTNSLFCSEITYDQTKCCIQSPFGGHELHTLSENEEERATEPSVMYQGPVFKETLLSRQQSDKPLNTSTLVGTNQNHSQSSMERDLHGHMVNIHSEHNFIDHPTLSRKFTDPITLSSDFSDPLILSSDFSSPQTPSEGLSNPTSLSHGHSILPALPDDISDPSNPLSSTSLPSSPDHERKAPPELPQSNQFDDLGVSCVMFWRCYLILVNTIFHFHNTSL